MNLNFIKHFLAVYDFGSVTKAADHLNITQPSMSSAIKNLKRVMGSRYF
jgi:DNA-binding transcriptional LysR family regulator